jgi:hypothetical protein
MRDTAMAILACSSALAASDRLRLDNDSADARLPFSLVSLLWARPWLPLSARFRSALGFTLVWAATGFDLGLASA